MKKFAAPMFAALTVAVPMLLLLCSTSLMHAQKYRYGQVSANPADYTLKVHITSTHFRTCAWDAERCIDHLYVDAILDGKKFEFSGIVDKRQTLLITPGDYLAMLPKKPRDGGRPVLGQTYYVLLADRSGWPCNITGFYE
jgi:hypothetical protein